MKKYFIRWRSTVNGRVGQGSKAFAFEEAENLIAELNADYPEIEHEIVEAADSTDTPAPGPELEKTAQAVAQ